LTPHARGRISSLVIAKHYQPWRRIFWRRSGFYLLQLTISSVVLGLGERVGNLLTAIDGADEDQKGPSGDNEA
jgi:hypothetical protein